MKPYTNAEMLIVGPLSQMAVGRGGMLDETQIAVYVQDLRDVDVEAFAIACAEIRRTRRKDGELAVPEVGMLIERTEAVQRRQALAARQQLLQAPSGGCLCRGTGWMPCSCPEEPCGKATAHGPHEWMTRCPCWLRANRALRALARKDGL